MEGSSKGVLEKVRIAGRGLGEFCRREKRILRAAYPLDAPMFSTPLSPLLFGAAIKREKKGGLGLSCAICRIEIPITPPDVAPDSKGLSLNTPLILQMESLLLTTPSMYKAKVRIGVVAASPKIKKEVVAKSQKLINDRLRLVQSEEKSQ